MPHFGSMSRGRFLNTAAGASGWQVIAEALPENPVSLKSLTKVHSSI